MADVFLSYHPEDYVAARKVVWSLRTAGLTVWFEDFTSYPARPQLKQRVAQELESASVVVVLWSFRSVNSDWVRQQAQEAVDRAKFVSALIERVELPTPFSGYHAADVSEGIPPDFVASIQLFTEPESQRGAPPSPEVQESVSGRFAACPAVEPSEPAAYPPGSEPYTGHGPHIDTADPRRIMVAVNSPSAIGTARQTIRAYLYHKSDEAQVDKDAKLLHGARHTAGQANVSMIQVGTPITVVINLPDVECRPRQRRFVWRGHWHKADFAVSYLGEQGGRTKGDISWFAGIVCIGQLTLDVELRNKYDKYSSPSIISAPGYESVFVSYSTEDATIVDWLETTYTALGMTYLRDVKVLRSGETWDRQLLKLIEKADLFQLCWSANAKQSPYVADEWRFALGLTKPNFIRPCYWEEPMPDPPAELKRLHFTKLKLTWMMRMWFRIRARFG